MRRVLMGVVTALVLVASTSRPRAQSGSGSLKVTSFPSGATVSIDGDDTGKVTPMSVSLAIGDHTVVVSIPNSGWSPDQRIVTIVSGNNDLSVTLLPMMTAGPKGDKGDTGPQGPKGDTGLQGPAGALGSYDQLSGLPCTTWARGAGTVRLTGLLRTPICVAGMSIDGRFLDMGSVVVDTATNLAWEKKDNAGGLHDVSRTFTWCEATGNSAGVCAGNTTSWIAMVNAEGFAGFGDWRVPTLDELVGILKGVPGCGDEGNLNPCIDAIFGPTQAWNYWSSLDFSGDTAGIGDFSAGTGNIYIKLGALPVRAVRTLP